jgi:hypothetical protein
LEITPLVLDRPDELFETNDFVATEIRWLFPGRSREQVAALIAACELTAGQKAALLDPKLGGPATNGWFLRPALDVVRSLSPSARRTLYTVLAESPENTSQHFPFFHRSDGFEEWVSACELSAEKIDLVRRLTYPQRGRLYFADRQLFALLSSSNETRCLFKTLTRVPTLLMELKVTAASDLEALADYWGSRSKVQETKRLLRSLARVPGGGSINISYFMAPVPRIQLYTYPSPAEAEARDCFWTSFNFFNDRPDDRLGRPERANETLQADYDPVRGPNRKFGDILLLLEDGDTAVHMCVHIAEDVVYTKNGNDPNQPWVLMRMKDLQTLYASEKRREWRVFRKRST